MREDEREMNQEEKLFFQDELTVEILKELTSEVLKQYYLWDEITKREVQLHPFPSNDKRETFKYFNPILTDTFSQGFKKQSGRAPKESPKGFDRAVGRVYHNIEP